jgi:hypothetical protein
LGRDAGACFRVFFYFAWGCFRDFVSGLPDRALKHDLPLDADRLQKGLVVAHHDQGAVESAQGVFQFLDRGEIEMVGRLVQQQK